MGVNGIYGLSGSGLDIESMVKVGMLSRQNQYDKMQQTYTKNEWQKQAYNDIYSSIQTFNNSTLSQYKMQSTMNAKTASSTSSAVSATANGSAPILNHRIQVNQLSSAAYMMSTNTLQRYDTDTGNKAENNNSIYLGEVLFKKLQYNLVDQKAHFTDLDGNESTANLSDVAFELKVDDGTESGKSIKYTYGQLLGQGNNNGAARSFNDLVSDVNNLGLNVRANYDSVNDAFSFYNKEGGEANTINFDISTDTQVASTTKAFLQNLHLFQSENGVLKGQDGSEVTDPSSATNYFGAESKAASITTTNALADASSGLTAGTDTALRDVFFTAYGPYDDDTAYVQFVGDDEITDVNLSDKSEFSFNLTDADGNSTEVSFTYSELLDDGATVQDLLDKINNAAENGGANIKASIDDEGKFTFTSNKSGESASVGIQASSDTAAQFLTGLGFANGNSDTSNTLTISSTENTSVNGSGADGSGTDFPINVKGTNGIAVIDGITYNNITDNKVSVNGVTYTMLDKTDGAVGVSVTQDTEGVIDKVKSFVEDYNKLLSSLYEKYDDKPNKDYKPLTESQKEQMKDEQIEKWEEKAKAGILYHDQTLSKLIYAMRDAVSTPIESINGKYDSVFSIGISTTGSKGQLRLDEDKLRAALNDDPDSVYNIFGKLDPKDSDNAAGNGVAQRLGDVFTDGMKSIRTRAGLDETANDDSDLGVLMRELQTKMSNFKKMMDSFENKLYKKYDAMEVALSRLGVQMNYITGGQ